MALSDIRQPSDLADLTYEQLAELSGEIREFIVESVAKNSGHLGSNLGAVELTLALHRIFESPRDAILWDTGHQSYVHKIVTGRRGGFSNLRQAGGISGYPSREESIHDFIENSHASTVLSYAYGMAVARDQGQNPDRRHIVAVIGDGSLTGGMAYEALNNLGHSKRRVIIVLNDNGRSYAPTISNVTSPITVSTAPNALDETGELARPQDRLTKKTFACTHRYSVEPGLCSTSTQTRKVSLRPTSRRAPSRTRYRSFQSWHPRVLTANCIF